MKRALLFFALVLIMCVVQGKHLHPRSIVRGEIEVEDDNKSEKMVSEIDGVPIDDVIRNIRPNRFVPINSVLFFKTYLPCEDGLERDMLGICREVWD